MAFHEISRMDLYEVIRRWHSGQGIRAMARVLGYDRKTIQRYTRLAEARGLSRSAPLPPKEEVLRILAASEQPMGRLPAAQTLLEPLLGEVHDLIHDKHLALKPKTAFEAISALHGLAGKVSYSSFKRFLRAHELGLYPERLTCRIELPPGEEVQIDYGEICLFFDPLEQRRRKLFAFIATLAHSRHKFVELTFKQDQVSFVGSHIRMCAFFGGTPARWVIDNLKNGVLSPDLYDPRLNRTYRELAEHYGAFIDPARVRSPKDKGKVEADVKTVRQAARKLIVLNREAPLGELNHLIRRWACQEYGGRPHGTTGEKPFEAFQSWERAALKPLPDVPFEPAEWREAKVHPDCYVQLRGKAYSVPFRYAGKTVWLKATEHLLQVFADDQLVKQHVVTGRYRTTDHADFPENVRAVLDTASIQHSLLERARSIGPELHGLVKDLLEVHAYMNLRRAQGLLTLAEGAGNSYLVERAAYFMRSHRMRATPHDFRLLLEKIQAEEALPAALPVSAATAEFVRDITYFINDQEGAA